MRMITVNGVDFTPFIALNGYNQYLEDLDASAERSMSGSLTRDRVARVPVIELSIRAMLNQSEVSKILKACSPAKISVNFYNTINGKYTTSDFYCNIKSVPIYSTKNGVVKYKEFPVKFIGFRGI